MRMFDVTVELNGSQFEVSIPATDPENAQEVAIESLSSRMEILEINEYKGKDW